MSFEDTTTAPTTVQGITIGGEDTVAEPRSRPFYSRFWMDLTGTFRCDHSFRAIDVSYKTDGSTETKLIDVPATFHHRWGWDRKRPTRQFTFLQKLE